MDERKTVQKEEEETRDPYQQQKTPVIINAATQLTLPACLKTFVKSFTLGCTIKTVINAISFFANPKKRRRFMRPPLGRTRLSMLRSMIDWRMGLFIGGLSTWKVLSMLLRKLISLRCRKSQSGIKKGHNN